MGAKENNTNKSNVANKNISVKQKAIDITIHIAQLFLYLMVSNLLLCAIFFVVNLTITWIILPLSFIASIGLLITFYGKKIGYGIIFEIISVLLLFVVFVWLIGLVYDTTWDGNNYHKVAVGLLSNGWNALYQVPSDVVSYIPSDSWVEYWTSCYCKMTWFFGASIYTIAGNIECGKVYTILGMITVFFITFYCLTKLGKKLYISLPIALLASFNPVAIQQCTTFYVDGFLHLMLFALLISLFMLYKQEVFNKKISISLVASCMIICANIKFTGLLFGGLFCLVYFVLWCLKEKKANDESYKKSCLIMFGIFACIAFVSVCVAGSNTYITNLIRHNHPLFPLMGEGAIDIMTANSPFTEVNHFKNFFISLFSYMQNFTYASGSIPTIKPPFTINTEKEFDALVSVDPRLSGFGLLFSGIFIISIIAIIIKLISLYKNKEKEKFWFILVNVVMMLGITFALTESWWARYAPCIYFVMLFGVYLSLDTGKLWLEIFGFLFLIVALANSLICTSTIVYNCYTSNSYATEIEKVVPLKEIYVYSESFTGIYYNLKDKGINLVVDDNFEQLISKSDFKYFWFNRTGYAPRNST